MFPFFSNNHKGYVGYIYIGILLKRWPHVIICLFDCSNSNYLECPGGRYGHNCQRDCSKHCMIKGYCNKVTGDCENGCRTGWKNSKCDLGNVNSYLNYFFILYSNSLLHTQVTM